MKMMPGAMVTTKFENKFVRLWPTCPKEGGDPKSEEEKKKVFNEFMEKNMGPMWPNGSYGTVLEVSGMWIRVMTPSGPGWIGEWSVEVVT